MIRANRPRTACVDPSIRTMNGAEPHPHDMNSAERKAYSKLSWEMNMTRNLPKILGALAVVGAVAVGTATPTLAQVYFDGPGVEFGIGPRWHHDYYYRDRDWRPYHHRYYRHYGDWD